MVCATMDTDSNGCPEFRSWATEVALRNGYEVQVCPVGTKHSVHGAPTQLAAFTVVSKRTLS